VTIYRSQRLSNYLYVAHWNSVREALRESLTGLIDYGQETWPFKYRKLSLAYLSWCHVHMASCAQPHAIFCDIILL
jgi:hypothetical protein